MFFKKLNMQLSAGLNYLNRSSISIINGLTKSNKWVLTPDGHISIYDNYVWRADGIWNPTWLWTPNS